MSNPLNSVLILILIIAIIYAGLENGSYGVTLAGIVAFIVFIASFIKK